MSQVVQEELNNLVEEHHRNDCASKENRDPEFHGKVQYRAYQIWERTHRSDERSNYFDAMEEIRKELCDCFEFARQYIVVEHKPSADKAEQKEMNIIQKEEEQRHVIEEHRPAVEELKPAIEAREPEEIQQEQPKKDEKVVVEELPTINESIKEPEEIEEEQHEQPREEEKGFEEPLPTFNELIKEPDTVEEVKPSINDTLKPVEQKEEKIEETVLPSINDTLKPVEEKEVKQQTQIEEPQETQEPLSDLEEIVQQEEEKNAEQEPEHETEPEATHNQTEELPMASNILSGKQDIIDEDNQKVNEDVSSKKKKKKVKK